MISCMVEKVRPLLMAKIVVQQHNVDLFQLRYGQSFGGGGAGGNDPQIRLGL